jgi:hypothetical protein
VNILTRIFRSGRRIRSTTLMRHQPFMDVFADWASKSNANETGPPMCADAAIKLAAADGTLKSKRIRSDLLQSLAFPAIGAPLMAPIEIPAIQWNGEWPRSMPHRPRPRYAPNAPPAWREAQNLKVVAASSAERHRLMLVRAAEVWPRRPSLASAIVSGGPVDRRRES